MKQPPLASSPTVEAVLPLTPLQAGMLFHASYDDQGVDVYLTQTPVELTGPLRVADLRAACEALLRRHPALRAGFLTRKSGEPVQVIRRAVEVPWREVDLSGSAGSEGEVALGELLRADLAERFDPAVPPLVRFLLVRLAAERHVLVMTNHHILLDGWSLPLVLRDLLALYGEGAVGLPEPVAFREYLVWLSRQDREAAAGAWRRALDGLDEPTLLAPADSPRDSAPPRRVVVDLGQAETEALSRAARARGLTLNSVVQSAWALTLAQLTGRRDVVFGATVSGRPAELAGVEDMVGLLINTVPVRVRVDPREPFERLARRVQDEQAELAPHQHLPLADIQRGSGLGELFDTALVFENAPLDQDALHRAADGLGIALLDGDLSSGAMHYPLSLLAVPGRRLRLDVNYRSDVVSRPRAERIAERLRLLLLAVADDPGTSTGRLALLAPWEHEQVLHAWNATAAGDSVLPGATMPELFARQVARTPDATALVLDGAHLTYAELDRRAERLARALRARGAGPSRLVAVRLPRSFELLVALYAVHKAGAAYLPIDVGHPAERVRFMLEDADPVVVVTEESYPLLAAEGDAAAPLEPVRPDPRQPAYLIYTSGSTGRPKGVLVPHEGVVNHLRWKQSAYPLGTGNRVLHKTPVTFDVSVWELFWPLATGATLVIARPDGHKDPAYLAGLIQREHIDLAHFVPSMLESFLHLPEAAGCTTLRRVICSGEALSQSLADRFHAVLDAELHNLYGPTEASVEITHGQSRPGASDVSVPIGRPIANSRTYVLGPGLRPAPIGTPGDLYLAGVQLAHGYQGRFGLTADRFVADPYGPPGSRMYRTGDVARWTEEGDLVFLGRSDDQVKIRGFRIELGEIEALLLRRPDVLRAAVLVREDQPGVKRLVAYVVPAAADGWDAEALRAHVAGELPEYMVPQAFVSLPELPLTTSGKLDRRALPAPRFAAAARGRAASSDRERTLCALFAEVLGVDGAGPDDGFFALGGDSIQSIQLVARARRAGLVITPRDVFQCRTPAALAAVAQEADAARGEAEDAGLGAFAPTPITHWLREQGADRFDGFNQTMLVRTPAAAGLPALTEALQALLDRHDALRMRLVEQDGTWSMHVPPPGAVRAADVLTRVDVHGLDDGALRAAVTAHAETARRALAPREGTVVRAVWFDAGAGQPGRLLLTVHHLAVDGVSWRILLPDLATAWQAADAGRQPRPAPVPTSLRTWSGRLAEEARDPRRVAELDCWTDQFDGGDPPLSGRPLDPAVDVYGTGRDLTLTLPAEYTGPLLTSVPQTLRAGIDELLLTALALAVAHWRQEDGRDTATHLLVDVEGHGRHEDVAGADLSRTVGWFTSLFPVRLDTGGTDWADLLSGGPALGQALNTVKARMRALPDRGIGYGLLRHLNPRTAAELAGHPRPQICFNYLGRYAAGEEGDWAVLSDPELTLPVADEDMPLPHALALNAVTEDGPAGPRLLASWTWASRLLDAERVEALAHRWFRMLRALVEYAADAGPGTLIPSDTVLGTLDPAALADRELRELERRWPGHRTADVLPLTPLQEGLLFHSSYDTDGIDVYNVQVVLELGGTLDADRLRRACGALLDRHDTLRTAFTQLPSGHPAQVVFRAVEVPWREVDLSGSAGSAGSEGEVALGELLRADLAERFDPAVPPLVRFLLVRLAAERHVLVMTNHHILLDGWSLPLVLRDLLALYGEGAVGLPEPVAFREYLVWLSRQDREAAAGAWRRALDGLDEPTLLVPRARSVPATELPRHLTVELGRAETEALSRAARARGLTLNSVVQSAWALTLAQLTGRRDVVFGATVSGRPAELAGVEDMVGLLINTVPVRVRVDPREPFERLARRVQDEQAELAPHQHLPLADIQRGSGLGELFDTALVFENYPDAPADSPLLGDGLRLTQVEGVDAYHYPLSVTVVPGERLRLRLTHRPELLDRETTDWAAAELVAFLSAVAARPQEPARPETAEARTVPVPAHRPTAGTARGRAHEAALRSLFAEVLGVGEVRGHDNFFLLGGDSLLALRLAGRIQEAWAVPVGPRTVFESPTPVSLAERLAGRGTA
ncbi:non-ribosomal peptide synthetase [Streptomyces fuscichromogenes]|uniref:Carrier domain-containing protein n=1 Tax=Streptomyces fuscichromogenes TaxID=1324013 RepID=A0A918CWY6_9ACTN|nr:non-ribosomal peptide synthetase [Streptomyces fuscichromogenes]GGN42457.1 hypothetical protein GCM10011578_091770 [Streptomyces fuscichromogenes]